MDFINIAKHSPGAMTTAQLCSLLQKFPTVPLNFLTPGDEIFIRGCEYVVYNTPNICEVISASTIANGGVATSTTQLLGADCKYYTLGFDIVDEDGDTQTVNPGEAITYTTSDNTADVQVLPGNIVDIKVVPCEILKALPNNNNTIKDGDLIPVAGKDCELKKFDTCEILKKIPVGVYDPLQYTIQLGAGSSVPVTSVGYDIDNNEIACSGGLPSTSEIGDFQLFTCGAQATPASPIPMANASAVNAFIASDLIPELNICLGTTYTASDIVYAYDAGTDVATVWFNPALDPTISPQFNIVIGALGSNSLCAKVFPNIPTKTPTPVGGCPTLVLPPKKKFRTVISPTANTVITVTHNLNDNIGIVQAWHLPTQNPVSFKKISEGVNTMDLEFNMSLTDVEITIMV